MTFGAALRELMKCVGMKQAQLAEYLGYDVSYISRWLSGTKLPSMHGSSSFFDKIIHFMLKDLSLNSRDAICRSFCIDPVLSDNELKNRCSAILADAYKNSTHHKTKMPTSDLSKITNNCNLSQLNVSLEYNNSLLAELTSELARHTSVSILESISLPFASDYGNYECIPFWMNILQQLPENTQLRLRMLADISDSDHYINICRDICSLYGTLKGNVIVEFYDIRQKFHSNESLLVFKDHLCVVTYEDTLIGARNVLITQDALQTEHYYGAVNYLLRGQFPLIQVSDFLLLYQRKFFQSFFAGTEFFSLHTIMPMVFADIKSLKKHMLCDNIPEQVLEIFAYHKKVLPRWSVFLYRSAVIQFLVDGVLDVFIKKILLTKTERQTLITDLIHELKEENHLFIINDVNPVLRKEDMEFSVSLGSQSMFLIQQKENIPSNIHYSTNDGIINCFQAMFKQLHAMPGHFIMKNTEVIDFLWQSLELIP